MSQMRFGKSVEILNNRKNDNLCERCTVCKKCIMTAKRAAM